MPHSEEWASPFREWMNRCWEWMAYSNRERAAAPATWSAVFGWCRVEAVEPALRSSHLLRHAEAVTYTYRADGKLSVRTWARGATPLTTTYTYYDDAGNNTAELEKIDYSDATPDVDFDSYDRMGRLTQVTGAVGTRTFSFDGDLNPDKEIINTSGDPQLYYREITREYEPEPAVWVTTGFVVGRPQKIQVGVSGDVARDYETEYFYDTGNARFNRVKGPGLPSYGAAYLFETNADLVNEIDFKTGSSTVVASSLRTWDVDRAALTSVENKWSATSISKYAYDYDTRGRREHVIRTGTAFSPTLGDHWDDWGYNERNELTASERYLGSGDPPPTTTPIPADDFEYVYDNIGNRESSTIDDPPATTTYTSNQLNQYSLTTNPSETITYDEDGNMKSDGSYTYEWDAENRLSVVWLVDPTPGTDEEGDRKLELVYDFMSRRVQKLDKLYTSSAWTTTLDRRFVYDGWNVLLELDGDDDSTVRSYTWGLDLSGTFQGAGGIAGLLAMHDPGAPDKNYIYFHDANGNVGQLVDIDNSGAIVAHYEYDPYGGVMTSSGAYKGDNPFRFSTKYWDDESGLGYWGYRYYSSRLGRWLGHDRVESNRSRNLFEYARSAPSFTVDILGNLLWRDPLPSDVKPRRPYDLLLLYCGLQASPVGASGANHCRLVCLLGDSPQRDFVADGTGPMTSPNDNGTPGYVDRPLGGVWPTSEFAGRVRTPLGTCDCINKTGAALNNIPNKSYGLTTSNSNSALSLVMRCCDVSMTPTTVAPGWNKPVKRTCGTRRQYRGNTWSELKRYCPIKCKELK